MRREQIGCKLFCKHENKDFATELRARESFSLPGRESTTASLCAAWPAWLTAVPGQPIVVPGQLIVVPGQLTGGPG